MKYYWIVIAIMLVGIVIGGINSDNLTHEKEIKKLELELKLKQK